MPYLQDLNTGNFSLAGLQDRGAVAIRFWCLGQTTAGEPCTHWTQSDIALLIERLGPKMNMVTLARRAGPCQLCGGRGAYVAPIWELAKGHTGWAANMEKVRRGLLVELEYVAKRLG